MIDIKKYIESGIITEYVLGSLSEKEANEVRSLAEIHPEIDKEIEATWLSLSVFVDMGATDPAEYMEERIWNEIQLIETSQTTPIEHKSNLFFKKSSFFYSLIVILSLVGIVAITWGVSTNKQLSEAKSEISELKETNESYSNLNRELEIWKSEIEEKQRKNQYVYNLPNAKIIKLNPNRKNSPNAVVFAIWDKETGNVYLDIKRLEATSINKTYQMWAISQIGRQINLGTFNYNGENEIKELGNTKQAVKFLITLEDQKGSKIPSLLNQFASARIY